MGAGASSAVLVRRDVKCPHRSFDGLAEIASTGNKCSCRACLRERQQASSPLMDTHDAYTLSTAMRVIERSHGKIMPPRRALGPIQRDSTNTAAVAATTASTILRRRAGIEAGEVVPSNVDTTPAGKENANNVCSCRNENLNSPVFEDSPVKPAMEAYSAAVLQAATAKQAIPACGRRARTPLQICKPDFTTSGSN